MVAAVLAVAGLLCRQPACAQDAGGLEYKVKAGYLFNFAKFIEWPASAFASERAPLVVASIDDGTVLPVLNQVLQGKNVNGRAIEVKAVTTLAGASGAHILFVARTAKIDLGTLREQLGRSSTLVVGEIEGFVDKGGTIGFVKEGDNLRFQLNLDTAGAAGLKISSKLSSVARVVKAGEKKDK